ncbi:hypothetical protein E2562_024267 [Oryza meyeriana var. granulata]|uniref:Uncharacterized protein n=1 Tax=Oryza meyeriana var. granulata TaxID=110450 RepID=A0A6G1E261_9ORYZ|nr:hypothetical protein E2562_024267 [Oryza meyeriana var. granulata]
MGARGNNGIPDGGILVGGVVACQDLDGRSCGGTSKADAGQLGQRGSASGGTWCVAAGMVTAGRLPRVSRAPSPFMGWGRRQPDCMGWWWHDDNPIVRSNVGSSMGRVDVVACALRADDDETTNQRGPVCLLSGMGQ